MGAKLDRESAHPLIGEVVGPYRIQSELGAGGMGVVYLAQHERLGRQVAIKVLRPELSSSAPMVARFFLEARTVNDIGHRNIVDVIDFVDQRQASPALVYLVMELLRGQSLARRLATGGALQPAEAVTISLQITSALVAVHGLRILHRDLKPANVFICEPESLHGAADAERRVKLLDFGVARVLDDKAHTETDPGHSIGTPAFMSPEQILGVDQDERCDIYAMGALMFTMLTGRPPFAGAGRFLLMLQHVQDEPPRVGELRTTGDPVPDELEEIVARCLRKEPTERFQTATALREALEGCLGPSLPGQRQRRGSSTLVGVRRELALLAGVAAAACLLACSALALYWPTDVVAPAGATPVVSAGRAALAGPAPAPAIQVDAGAADGAVAPPPPDAARLATRVRPRPRPSPRRRAKPATKKPPTKVRAGSLHGTIDPYAN